MNYLTSPFARAPYYSTGKIKTEVTYLQMFALPQDFNIPQPRVKESDRKIKKLENPQALFYRTLYHGVGGSLTWTGRKLLTDSQLQVAINSKNINIYVLYVKDEPAGYIEFTLNPQTKEVELDYFGLMPKFYGNKLGPYLLNTGIQEIFKEWNPSRLWLHTCDLDHPEALNVYHKSGFQDYKTQTEEVASIAPNQRYKPLSLFVVFSLSVLFLLGIQKSHIPSGA